MLAHLILLYSYLFPDIIYCDYFDSGVILCENKFYVMEDHCTVPCNFLWFFIKQRNIPCYSYDKYITYSGIKFIEHDRSSGNCGCKEKVRNMIEYYRSILDWTLVGLDIENI